MDLPSLLNSIWIKQIDPPGQMIESNNQFINIGRGPNNMIRIEDPKISWEHGQIVFMQETYHYRHLSTVNPSILQRRGEEYLLRPGKKEEIPLRNQDLLILGNTTFLIKFNIVPDDIEYKPTEKKPEANSPENELSEELDLVKLRQLLITHFNNSELRDLYFDLGVSYDDVEGTTKGDKARELIAFCQRHRRLLELQEFCQHQRPDISWQDAYK